MLAAPLDELHLPPHNVCQRQTGANFIQKFGGKRHGSRTLLRFYGTNLRLTEHPSKREVALSAKEGRHKPEQPSGKLFLDNGAGLAEIHLPREALLQLAHHAAHILDA